MGKDRLTMRKVFSNAGYFLRETILLLRSNLLSNLLTLFSTGLIFFILAMVISGWWVSSRAVEVIQGEAEINAYFDKSMDDEGALRLAERLRGIAGVREARVVDEREAYGRMVKILGKDARVLEIFEDNPFSSFIEIKINLDEIDPVLAELAHMAGIEHVRDNRDVLDRLRSIAGMLWLLGCLVVAAVGISTLVVVSHMIRLGIQDSREQINTLRLLGAPEIFIAFPFLLEGWLLTLGGGMLAAGLTAFVIQQLYARMAGPLPFIPLPPGDVLVSGMVAGVLALGTVLGIAGSLLGLSSARNK